MHLVRHGKAEHNRATGEVGSVAYDNEACYDAKLDEEGISQAVCGKTK